MYFTASHIRWCLSQRHLLLIVCALFMTGSANEGFLDKKLVDCLQGGSCGAFSVCSYSFLYEEPCAGGINCTGLKTGTNEHQLEGNIMLMKNGIDRTMEYTWNVVGYVYDSKADDASARRYMMPPMSYVYFDTQIAFHHTVRIINNGQVVNTEISSRHTCTQKEACEYLLKTCQAAFVFLDTFSMEPKIACLTYAKACNYHVYMPDLSLKSMDDNDAAQHNTPSDTMPSDGPKTSISVIREDTNICVVDCIWKGYPSMWLPAAKAMVQEFVDTLDMVRRLHLGISMKPDACKSDKAFIDDELNIFRTTDDDDMYAILNHGKSGTNTAVVVILSIMVAMLAVCMLVVIVNWYLNKKRKMNKHSSPLSYMDDNAEVTL